MSNPIPKLYVTRMLKRCVESPVPSIARDKELKKPCLIWQGATDQDGYGVMRLRPWDMNVASGIIRVHRFSYWYHISPFPLACEIDHKCRAKRCVEPEHLQMLGPTGHAEVSNIDRWKHDKLRVK